MSSIEVEYAIIIKGLVMKCRLIYNHLSMLIQGRVIPVTSAEQYGNQIKLKSIFM